MKNNKLTREQRLYNMTQLPTPDRAFQVVVNHIVNGGSLITIAEANSVPYCEVVEWIRSDEELSRKYDQAQNDRAEWAREAVLTELRSLALSDPRNLFTDDGKIKPLSEWPKESAHCISNLEVHESKSNKDVVIKKIKFWDKPRALEMMGKNLHMFINEMKIEHTHTLEDLITATQQPKQIDLRSNHVIDAPENTPVEALEVECESE